MLFIENKEIWTKKKYSRGRRRDSPQPARAGRRGAPIRRAGPGRAGCRKGGSRLRRGPTPPVASLLSRASVRAGPGFPDFFPPEDECTG